jgi:hypothetical protein
MNSWLEKIHSLSSGMLFTQGHLLPSLRDESAPKTRTPRRDSSARVSVMQRCADAARAIVQRPRLIQPH